MTRSKGAVFFAFCLLLPALLLGGAALRLLALGFAATGFFLAVPVLFGLAGQSGYRSSEGSLKAC